MGILLIAIIVAILFAIATCPAMVRKPLRHDRDRRRLDPSQKPQPTPITANVTSSGTTNVTVDFDQPVSINGRFGIAVDTLTVVEQQITGPTQLQFTMSGDVAGHFWTIPANDPAVRNKTGGFVAPATNTF